ncbi:uncharacterized protein LOC108028332 [Drosophila biarmipes]|uniref:uncharacterized protein LOC108028332 n=1 Tax=Drosophila biarmipes TaxID=125945 RepID=UPI001CDAB497|nr:uncharacterized protein LOC108028332 [Drosophila biarmipes]
MSSPDDIPGPSKQRTKKRSPRASSRDSNSKSSSPPTTSNGRHGGSASGGSPIGGRSPAGNRSPASGGSPAGGRSPAGNGSPAGNRSPLGGQSPAGGRSPLGGQSPSVGPTNMRDRLLVANAIAMNVSAGESTASSSSPQLNGHYHYDSDELNGGSPSGSSNNKKKKTRERLVSGDSALMGWTGEFPKLTAMANIDSSSDLEPQSPGELRALGRRGLRVFPRVEPQAETAGGPGPSEPAEVAKTTEEQQPQQQQQQDQQQQQSLASPPSPMITSPVGSSLSSNSDLNLTTSTPPGRGPGQHSEPDQPFTLVTTATSTNLNTTTTTAVNTANATGTATTASPRTTATNRLQTESDNQEKNVEKEQPTKTDGGQQPSKADDKQQQQPADDDEEEQIEPLVMAEDESNSSVPLDTPPTDHRSGKRAFSPIAQESKLAKADDDTRKTKEDEAKVPLDKGPNGGETEEATLPVSSLFAKRAKSLSTESKLEPRTSRFSSQDPSKPVELMVPTSRKEPDVKPEAVSETPPAPSALKLKATDEFYRLPFAYGWKRELVLPSSGNPKRRTGDVFFIAPNGRKLRSREDIIPMLEGELTIEHFCFQRQAQEAGPEYELVRRATPSNVLRNKSQQAVMQPTSSPVTGKRVSKPKVPKGASPPSEGWTATMAVKGNARVLASSNGGSPAGPPTLTSSTRKRSFMSRQTSRVSSEKIFACLYCQAPMQMTKNSNNNICSNCSKIARKKKRESERSEVTTEPQPDVEDMDDDQKSNDGDDDNESADSLMEIGEEIEVPGQHPPAELFNNLAHRRSPKDQEVVVIGGRKAIAIKADPPRRPVKVVPRQPDLTGYEKIYKKRIQGKSASNDLVESLGDAHTGCQVLMAIMKTLNLKERANMSRVCKTWAMVSREMSVWRSVSLRDTYIGSWVFFLRELARHRTRELDMMGVIMAKPQLRCTGDMRVLKALRVLRTDAVDTEFLHLVFRHLSNLLELRATCTTSSLNLSHLEQTEELRVLRIHMTDPKSTLSSLSSLAKLRNLTELSLRGVSNLGKLNMMFLKDLPRLEVLALGSCQDLNSQQFGKHVLPTLKHLHSFRLENDHKGMAMFPVDDIMRGLAIAGGVQRLELVNVDVDGGFSPLLAACPSVTDLLLTPKCMHNTANMTNAVMQAISDNAEQLRVFRLGLVTQLLSATGTLYKGKGKDVIPVQRPVPGIPDEDQINHCTADDDCQELDHAECVAFLPLERLEAILHHMMPHAWLTVAKVAMCDTTSIKFLPRPEESSEELF